MALSVTTDLVRITDAETATGWTTYGGAGAGALALEPDFFIQGSNCISRGVSGAVIKGMCFDIGAGTLNFVTTHAGKLIYIWMRTSTPGLCDTRTNGGIRIVLGSGATAPADAAGVWSAWYVDGSDTIIGTDGWKCYVLDPTLPPSTTFGGGVDLTAVKWFGGVQRSIATLKGQNFGIDAIYYGFGNLTATGTTTANTGFLEMATADFGTVTNRYGITTIKENIILVQGKLIIGDPTGSLSTTFTSENETLAWGRPTYLSGTTERNAVKNMRPDGTPYFGIVRAANATSGTNFTIGAKVGVGDTASGRSGGSFIGSRINTSFEGNSGSLKSGSLNIYGATFTQFRGGFSFISNSNSAEFLGNTVGVCGTVVAGPAAFRNVQWIDNYGGAYKFLEDFTNDSVVTESLAVADPSTDWVNATGGTQFVVPAKSLYVRLDAAATTKNVVKVNSDVVEHDNHYAEATIFFPSGSDQGPLGVLIRGDATAATENYYFLQVNRPSSSIDLIRCDAGVDTILQTTGSYTFASGTNYLVHLRGSGSYIEGFVNGVRLSASLQTSYQTNRRVGIRGTTSSSQTANGEPRLYRFGCGPVTDNLGAVSYPNSLTASVVNCKFLNNSRATAFYVSGSYAVAGMAFSGNAVDLLNSTSGSLTINASNGQSPFYVENVATGTTTINNTITHTITGLAASSRVIWIRVSDDAELANVVESGGNAIYSYNYTTDTVVDVQILSQAYRNKIIQVTLGSTNATLPASQTTDPFYSNP